MTKGNETILLDELKKIQKSFGYLKESELIKLSEKHSIPLSKIYATASFYSFLKTEKRGRYVIRVCDNLSCIANGSGKIIDHLKGILGISPGEITKDGMFSLETTSCMGQCNEAPTMMINEKVYTGLDEKEIDEIIGRLKK